MDLGCYAFKEFSLVVDSLPVVPHISGERRTEAVPPVSCRFMTDVNTAFMQQSFRIAK